MNFSDLGLSPDLLRAITDAGYETPTPIQAQAIPEILARHDVVGCAQTGTGKTASFTLPMIQMLAAGRARARMSRSLILEPTRELATQVAENFQVYGKYNKLSMALLIGGVAYGDQDKKLDRGVDVLIATPGRLLDHFERGRILLNDVRTLVIDEADRMLDMGFIPDVERIVGLLPPSRQTLLFSATMPPEIRRLANAFLTNPKTISVAPPASPAETVTQALVFVEAEMKREVLRQLLGSENVKTALIFCNRKRDVDILARSLKRHGYNAAALHGDMPQDRRTETLESFKRGEISLLVASDVAARGLDIDELPHVFLFDVPIHAEDYIHRIGRTGRAGRSGKAITLVSPEDRRHLSGVVRMLGKDIPLLEMPGLKIEQPAAALPTAKSEDSGPPKRARAISRSPRQPRPPSAEKPAQAEVKRTAAAAEPKQLQRTPAPSESRKKPRPAEEADGGLGGDQLPAFLMRPVRGPKAAA